MRKVYLVCYFLFQVVYYIFLLCAVDRYMHVDEDVLKLANGIIPPCDVVTATLSHLINMGAGGRAQNMQNSECS